MNSILLTTLSFIAGHLTSKYVTHVECFGKQLVDTICRLIYEYETHSELEELAKGVYSLPYHYHGKLYRVLIKIQRGPKRVSRIEDEYGEDVTETVCPFLGPDEQCHRQSLTPGDLGYDQLELTLVDETSRVFERDDNIDL